MFQELPSLAHTELVQIISDVYENFRDTFEQIVKADAVLFFPSIIHVIPAKNEGEADTIDVHYQPIVMPTGMINTIMTDLMNKEKMEVQEFYDYLVAVYNTMWLNTKLPAPTILHPGFVEMFGTIVINGMPDKRHLTQKLTKLEVGDLVVVQVELTGNVVNTGMEVIPHALDVYNATTTMTKHSKTMH